MTPPPPEQPDRDAAPTPAPKRCGRCQVELQPDPTLEVQLFWALCPSCDATLLPGRAERMSAIADRSPRR